MHHDILIIKANGPLNAKFINAKQTKQTHQYKNTKEKLYKTNAEIWYNKIWGEKQLASNYTYIQYVGKHNPIHQLIYNTFNMSLPTRPTDQYPTFHTTKPVDPDLASRQST